VLLTSAKNVVHGAASVDPGAEPTVVDQKVDQALLGAVTPIVVLADQLASRHLGSRRVPQDLLEWGSARRDLGCAFDDEPQLATSVLLATRILDPVLLEYGEWRVVARDRNVQRGSQHRVLGTKRLVDGRRSNKSRLGDALHCGIDVPLL